MAREDRQLWVKFWDAWYTSPSHAGLSERPLGMGGRLMLLAAESPRVPVLLGPGGVPLTALEIGRAARIAGTDRTVEKLALAALGELVKVKTLVVDAEGAYGFTEPAWAKFQGNSPSAKRMEKSRKKGSGGASPARHSDAESDADVTQNEVENASPERHSDADVTRSSRASEIRRSEEIRKEDPEERDQRSEPRAHTDDAVVEYDGEDPAPPMPPEPPRGPRWSRGPDPQDLVDAWDRHALPAGLLAALPATESLDSLPDIRSTIERAIRKRPKWGAIAWEDHFARVAEVRAPHAGATVYTFLQALGDRVIAALLLGEHKRPTTERGGASAAHAEITADDIEAARARLRAENDAARAASSAKGASR